MTLPLQRIFRYLGYGVLGLLGLVLLAVVVVTLGGGRRLSATHVAPTHGVAPATDSADIAEGGRLAAFWGCVGCHESDAGGGVFFETPVGDRIVAPNLTRIVREYDDAALERAIRHGLRSDGSSVAIMPSRMFAGMSDQDLAKVVGYLRSLPAVPDTLPRRRMGLIARFFVLTEDDALEAPAIDHGAPHPASPDSLTAASSRADTLALGRYLAFTGCPECHGTDLMGNGEDIPSLIQARAYTPEGFRQFFRDGVGVGDRDLGLMSSIARGRGGRLTDPEAFALHAYLLSLGT